MTQVAMEEFDPNKHRHIFDCVVNLVGPGRWTEIQYKMQQLYNIEVKKPSILRRFYRKIYQPQAIEICDNIIPEIVVLGIKHNFKSNNTKNEYDLTGPNNNYGNKFYTSLFKKYIGRCMRILVLCFMKKKREMLGNFQLIYMRPVKNFLRLIDRNEDEIKDKLGIQIRRSAILFKKMLSFLIQDKWFKIMDNESTDRYFLYPEFLKLGERREIVDTQIACLNNGTDGQCYWVPQKEQDIAFCRLQQCSDATTNNLTHLGCSQFTAQTACTTSGQGCIQQGLCQSYNIQEGCVQGTDGVCFWEQQNNNPTTFSTQICRLKQCTDVILTTSASCLNSINGIQCVSNGINCIKKSQCSSYIDREACYGGGVDGKCAFTPTNSSDIGTCVLFSSCQLANQDQLACNSRSDVCFFNQTFNNGTTTTSCQPHTCQTKQQGTQCLAVPSWDLSQYRICVLKGVTCIDGNTNELTAQTCYQSTVATYTWNLETQTCQACIKTNAQINNTVNNTNNTDSNGYLARIIILVYLWMI